MLKQVIQTYRRSFTGLSTEVWWLGLVLLINRSGTMVTLFLTIYLTVQLHYNLTQAGIVAAFFGAGSILGAFAGGWLTDRIGHSKVQLTALCGGGVLFVLLGYVQHYAAICAMAFVLAMVSDAFRPANFVAVAAYSTPENRTRSYTLNRLAINLGWAVGASVGGLLAGISYRLVFWVDGLANILAGLVLWKVLYRPGMQKDKKAEADPQIKAPSPYRDLVYLRFVLLAVLYGSCFILMFRVIPVYYKVSLHLPEAFIGMVMGLNGIIIAFFEMVLVNRWEGKRSQLVYIRRGSYLLAAGFLGLLLPVNGILLSILSMVVFTFSEILTLPFMNSFMIGRTREGNRGAYAAVYTICWSVSQMAGPSLGGLVVDNFGYTQLWIGASALCLLCGLGVYWLREGKATSLAEAANG